MMMYRCIFDSLPKLLIALVVAAGLAGCGDEGEAQQNSDCELTRPPAGEFFDKLSDYCFFQGNIAAQKPSDGVVPYDVNTKLYSDRSSKFRFMVLPEGAKITFRESERWDFPVGTILVKTFYFPKDARDPSKGLNLIETRLLMRGEEDWETHTYRWNEAQTDATSFLIGTTLSVDWVDENGEPVQTDYNIPSKSDCRNCHASGDNTVELGPRTRQLNRVRDFGDGPVNQLEYYEQLGMFTADIPEAETLPKLIDPKDESFELDERARAYLEGNCAHCHNPSGAARNSGLFLNIEQEDRTALGICKHPIAAGRGAGDLFYDIVPGHPEKSIMVYRMNSMEPAVKMPELPLTTIDHFGVNLISEWISNMEGECPPPDGWN
jgi:uncharacterized repeat protein (TIGR03806 family)